MKRIRTRGAIAATATLSIAGGLVAVGILTATPALAATVSGTQVVSGTASVAANSTGSLILTCPSGKTVTSGGFEISEFGGVPGGLLIQASRPLNSTQWIVTAKNPTTATRTLSGSAVCSSGGGRAYPSTTFTVPASTIMSKTVTCPNGVSVGGGFAINLAELGVVVDVSRPASSGQGWTIQVRNTFFAPKNITMWAVCADLTGRQVVTNQGVAGPNNTNPYITADCPTGKVTTGGGWAHGAPNNHLWESVPIQNGGVWRTWQLRLLWNSGEPSYGVIVDNVCVSGT